MKLSEALAQYEAIALTMVDCFKTCDTVKMSISFEQRQIVCLYGSFKSETVDETVSEYTISGLIAFIIVILCDKVYTIKTDDF